MNQYIIDKWYGGIDFNSSIMNMATSYSLFVNHNDVYSTDNIFQKLYNQIITFNKSNVEHVARYYSWKHSMKLRYLLDLGFVFIITLVFQIYIANFNSYLREAQDAINKILDDNENGNMVTEETLSILHTNL